MAVRCEALGDVLRCSQGSAWSQPALVCWCVVRRVLWRCFAVLSDAWRCLAVLGGSWYALDLACFSRLRVRTRRARDIKTTRPVPSLASPAIHELAVGMCRETRPLLPTHWSLRGASLGPLTTHLFHRFNCSTTTELSSCYAMEQPIL